MEKLKLELFIVFLTKIHRLDPFAKELAEFDDSRCVNSDFVEKEEREREREEAVENRDSRGNGIGVGIGEEWELKCNEEERRRL